MKPHYYNFFSRLGLINPPNGQVVANKGVEDGPTAILSEQFLHELPGLVDGYTFSLPETVNTNAYFSTLAKESAAAADLISHTLVPQETQVVIGGDHSVAFPSLIAVSKRVNPHRIAYIQFDSHTDIHVVKTSPSGNFHGMYVRAFVDAFDQPEIDELFPNKIPSENVWYIGNLDMEPEEKDFISTHSIRTTNRDEIQINQQFLVNDFKKFLHQFDHIHVTFDVDMFDGHVVAATGIPCLSGLFWEDIEPFIQAIRESHKPFSLDLVEVNPKKMGAWETIDVARRVLISFLQG